MKIIDFHTHPILCQEQSLVMYKDAVQLDANSFQAFLCSRGIQKFCGSVLQPQHITTFDETWKVIKKCNDTAFRLQEYYQGKYIPGVLIHPQHVNDSVQEIDRAIQHGSNLIGEIFWYIDGWKFDDSGLDELLCYAAEKNMVLSVHPSDDDSMNASLARHPDLCIVGAHPGDWNRFFSQLERLKHFDNYILDISAHGIERIGSIKKLVNAVGSERIVFGSDFPSCDPIAFIACVENDPYFGVVKFNSESADNCLEWSIDNEDYMGYMAELNKLVQADVISQNSLVDNSAAFTEKMMNGHYAVIYGNSIAQASGSSDVTGDGWAYRPVWVNVPMNKEYGGVASAQSCMSISIFNGDLSSEQLTQLVHALDYLYSDVGVNNMYWGPASAGLYAVDDNGNRYYTNEDVKAEMLDGADNGACAKYGLVKDGNPGQPWMLIAMANPGSKLLKPKYLAAGSAERDAARADYYFNPGTLSGYSKAENTIMLNANATVYSYGAANVEALAEFWNARPGFENQMKKVICAANEDEYNKQFQVLVDYATENGLTDESLKTFTDLFVAANGDLLNEYGIVK